jgi:hypothetical protein
MTRNVLQIRMNSTKNNKPDLRDKIAEDVVFAHESEKEFARILDFYRIKWEYEPRTFILEWDEDNLPKKSFTPDFYLPDFDLYIELTTLNQKLVTKKNGKLKRLRKMYPDINAKLFYKKDYNSLLFKYLNR